jgi:uncharacterized protein (TIGR02246 family)
MHRPFLIALAGLLLGACSATPTRDDTAAADALLKTSREWAGFAASGDAERIASYWADDAIVMPPDQPALVGKAAILNYVRGCLALKGFSVTWEPERAVITGDGTGYLIEHTRFTVPADDGTVHTQIGKAVTIWRREPSGAWKCVVDTWNGNPQERVLP